MKLSTPKIYKSFLKLKTTWNRPSLLSSSTYVGSCDLSLHTFSFVSSTTAPQETLL